MRKDSRETVFKLTYSYLITGIFDDKLKTQVFSKSGIKDNDLEFADKLLNFVKANINDYLEIIANLSRGFSIDRICFTDKAAIITALAEINGFEDIPNVVTIDETLSIVKAYSEEKSIGYVNGLLAEYIKTK